MAEERDDEQTNETEGTTAQQPTSEQGQQPIAGQQGQQSQFGQSQGQPTGDFASQQQTMSGGQGATGQTQSGSDGDTMTGERGSDQSGQGFVGSQGTGSDEYLQEGEFFVGHARPVRFREPGSGCERREQREYRNRRAAGQRVEYRGRQRQQLTVAALI